MCHHSWALPQSSLCQNELLKHELTLLCPTEKWLAQNLVVWCPVWAIRTASHSHLLCLHSLHRNLLLKSLLPMQKTLDPAFLRLSHHTRTNVLVTRFLDFSAKEKTSFIISTFSLHSLPHISRKWACLTSQRSHQLATQSCLVLCPETADIILWLSVSVSWTHMGSPRSRMCPDWMLGHPFPTWIQVTYLANNVHTHNPHNFLQVLPP